VKSATNAPAKQRYPLTVGHHANASSPVLRDTPSPTDRNSAMTARTLRSPPAASTPRRLVPPLFKLPPGCGDGVIHPAKNAMTAIATLTSSGRLQLELQAKCILRRRRLSTRQYQRSWPRSGLRRAVRRRREISAAQLLRANCKWDARCGDGVIQANTANLPIRETKIGVAGSGCTATCGVPAVCGDGVVQAPETCDDGTNDGKYGGARVTANTHRTVATASGKIPRSNGLWFGQRPPLDSARTAGVSSIARSVRLRRRGCAKARRRSATLGGQW